MKKHIQAADADLVRTKTERQLTKPAVIMQPPSEQLPDTNMKSNPLSSEFHMKLQKDTTDKDSEPKEQTKRVVDKKISSQTFVSRNQRNGTLHIKVDKQFFEILNGSNLENNSLHT